MEATLLDRLCPAINAHDLEGIAACFAEDYRCDIPGASGPELHRTRPGPGQLGALLKAVPDLTATIVRQIAGDGTQWGEWEQRGTAADGSPHLVRGVVIVTMASELALSALLPRTRR